MLVGTRVQGESEQPESRVSVRSELSVIGSYRERFLLLRSRKKERVIDREDKNSSVGKSDNTIPKVSTYLVASRAPPSST